MLVVDEMIEDKRRVNSLNFDKLRVVVFFFQFLAARIFSLVNRFCRKSVVGKFEFDGETVRVSEFYDIVALADS